MHFFSPFIKHALEGYYSDASYMGIPYHYYAKRNNFIQFQIYIKNSIYIKSSTWTRDVHKLWCTK